MFDELIIEGTGLFNEVVRESLNPDSINARLEEISMIESLTPDDIEQVLLEKGIKKGSGDIRDYHFARKTVFKGHWITTPIYHRHREVIMNFLGV